MKMQFKLVMNLLCAGVLVAGAPGCDDSDPEPGQEAVCGEGDLLEVDGGTYCVYAKAIIETGFNCPAVAPHRLQYGNYTVCGSSDGVEEPLRDEIHDNYDADELPPREATVCQDASGCGVGTSCSRGVCEPLVNEQCATDADCGVGTACVDNTCQSNSPVCTTDADCASGERCDDSSKVCVAVPAEICCNGLDDDGDGLIDSNDIDDCLQEVCEPVSCQQDADCGSREVCFDGRCTVPFDEVCDDTVDNDLDGLVDCADTDCAAVPQCQGPVSCLDDVQCAPGQICDGGLCVTTTPCVMNDDCGIGTECVDGTCRSNSPACLSDDECQPDELCSEGLCVVPVSLPEDCSDGLDNDGDGAVDCSDVDCISEAVCQSVSCSSDVECAAGQECESASQTCIYVMCMTDADCSVDSLCFNGTCQGNSPACMLDADCHAGQVCHAGQCVTQMCMMDVDCTMGSFCIDGACMESVMSCQSDMECAAGQTCVNGSCQG